MPGRSRVLGLACKGHLDRDAAPVVIEVGQSIVLEFFVLSLFDIESMTRTISHAQLVILSRSFEVREIDDVYVFTRCPIQAVNQGFT